MTQKLGLILLVFYAFDLLTWIISLHRYGSAFEWPRYAAWIPGSGYAALAVDLLSGKKFLVRWAVIALCVALVFELIRFAICLFSWPVTLLIMFTFALGVLLIGGLCHAAKRGDEMFPQNHYGDENEDYFEAQKTEGELNARSPLEVGSASTEAGGGESAPSPSASHFAATSPCSGEPVKRDSIDARPALVASITPLNACRFCGTAILAHRIACDKCVFEIAMKEQEEKTLSPAFDTHNAFPRGRWYSAEPITASQQTRTNCLYETSTKEAEDEDQP